MSIAEADQADILDILKFMAGRMTVSEVMFGDKLPVASVEERIADMGRRRAAHDAAVLKARDVLSRIGGAA